MMDEPRMVEEAIVLASTRPSSSRFQIVTD